MTDEYTSDEQSLNLVTDIIREYIHNGLRTADTGEPSGLDKDTWERCIGMMRGLWLAEPHLPAWTVIKTLKFAGWQSPNPEPTDSERYANG